MKDFNLYRLNDFEDNLVKYAVGNKDESIIATLVNSKLDNEMEIRFVVNNRRFYVSGGKSIMNSWTFEKFKHKVIHYLSIDESLDKMSVEN